MTKENRELNYEITSIVKNYQNMSINVPNECFEKQDKQQMSILDKFVKEGFVVETDSTKYMIKIDYEKTKNDLKKYFEKVIEFKE